MAPPTGTVHVYGGRRQHRARTAYKTWCGQMWVGVFDDPTPPSPPTCRRCETALLRHALAVVATTQSDDPEVRRG